MLRLTELEAAAAAVREQVQAGRTLVPHGGRTKMNWLRLPAMTGEVVELDMRGMNRMVEHNVGDFTAIVDAGMRLTDAQKAFAAAGQMLALDPPLGVGDGATIGGILASNDSGPLRHRYGGIGDLAIGMTAILSDGTVSSSGGRVIKNVAGYDLAKLFVGSYGSLGLIARVAVRLHPKPESSATLIGKTRDPAQLTEAVAALGQLPLEADCLDVNWQQDEGTLLVRFSGAVAEKRARRATAHPKLDCSVLLDDDDVWLDQRARQRSADGFVVKFCGLPTDLPRVIETARAEGGTVVSRAGLSWITVDSAEDVAAVRAALGPRRCLVLDGADRIADAQPTIGESLRKLMGLIQERFDPPGAFTPGSLRGGI